MPKLKIVDKNGNPLVSSYRDFDSLWTSRLETSNKRHAVWSTKFRTAEAEEYYYGQQWEIPDGVEYRPYVTNEIFAAIDVKAPSLLFQSPVFSIRPKPSKRSHNIEASSRRAFLRQNTLNYFASQDKTGLAEASELAILDAFFRFGIVEVGYSADWIDNPNFKAPVLNKDREKTSDEPEVVYTPPKLPARERIYVKHVPAENFRVGGIERPENLERCSWYGYWEWYRYEDVRVAYNLDDRYTGEYSDDVYGFNEEVEVLSDELQEMVKSSRLVKVWKIWDTHEKQKLTYVEGPNKIVRQEDYENSGILELRFRKRLKAWYPIPPVFNWLSPQDEMNETREVARQHRKRFVRKFIMRNGAMAADQIELLQNGGDGTFAETLEDVDPSSVIIPLPNADLGAHHAEMLQISRLDFDNVAGVTPEQRGQAQTSTATQSNIIEAKTDVRESRDQHIVAKWMCEIGKEIIKQAKDNLVENIIIPIVSDSMSEMEDTLGEMKLVQQTWREISTDSLGDEDMDVNIKISSMSPTSNQHEKEAMMEFLAILNQYPQMALSPVLVREAASAVGFHNEEFIQTWQKYALLQMTATMAQLELANMQLAATKAAATGNPNGQLSDSSNPIAQRDAAQATPNTQGQIEQQVTNQSVQ